MAERSLDERRAAAGLKVAALARKAGVTYHRVWRACTGGLRLKPDEEERIERVLREEEP